MTSDDPPRDPRSVLRAHRPAVGHDTPAADRVDRLLKVQGAWLRVRVQRTARHFRLDPDELCQELMLGMLRRSTTVDEANRGVRTWLSVRVERTAIDLIRSRGRETPAGPEEFEAFERAEAASGRWPADPHTEITLNVHHLVAMGLTAHEAQTVAMRCTGVDMTLKEFAVLVGRTHAAVRQEYTRGTRKIENLFGLTVEEAEVIRALRRHGSPHAAARAMRRPYDDVVRAAEDAHKKIDRVFVTETTDVTEKEGLL